MMPNLALLQKSSLCTFIIAGFFFAGPGESPISGDSQVKGSKCL